MRTKILTAVLTAIVSLAPATSWADVPPGVDKEGTVGIGSAWTWEGAVVPAANTTHTVDWSAGTCGKATTDYCELVLIEFDLPFAAGDTKSTTRQASASISIDGWTLPNDYDLLVYRSDESGVQGDFVDLSGDFLTESEGLSLQLESTRTFAPDGSVRSATTSHYFLAKIVYYVSVQGSFTGRAAFTSA